MKTALRKSEQGSTLVITFVISILVGTVLCSYLQLITNRNTNAMRAMAWNSAIPVLEAGIEEALTHLHDDNSSPTANQWDIAPGLDAYLKTRSLPDGSTFSVIVSNYSSTAPVIYSVGSVKSPLRTDQFITRTVRVTTTNPPSVFPYPINANGIVRLNGDSIVDGYDPAAGPYDPVKNHMATGGIATNSKEQKAIDVGSGHVYGKAVTGPGGTVSASGGTVGDLGWTDGINKDWVNNNMNVQYQPNEAPSGIMRDMPAPITGGGSNIMKLTPGSYQAPSFLSNDQKKPLVISGGEVTLWVTGDFIVLGSGYVYIEPGAKLNLYVGSDSATPVKTSVSGGGIVNGTGDPNSFSYFGMPNNTQLNYSGKADFIGTINAPQADFRLSGQSSVYGAIICNTFTSTGQSNVHYDQALGQKGIFVVTSWREM